MCIAVLNKGPKLDRRTLETMWQSNPQGGGLMYVDKNTKELVTYKTMFDKKMFWEYDLAKHRARTNSWRTTGPQPPWPASGRGQMDGSGLP